MNYRHASHELTAMLNAWKPDPPVSEVLEMALQALEDCMDMGLVGDEADDWIEEGALDRVEGEE